MRSTYFYIFNILIIGYSHSGYNNSDVPCSSFADENVHRVHHFHRQHYQGRNPNENAENGFSKTYLRLFRMKCEEYDEMNKIRK